jgi:hypothetical protein
MGSREMRHAYTIVFGCLKGQDYLIDLGVHGVMILNALYEDNVNWLYVAQYQDQWRSLVNKAMNVRVS